MRDVGYGCVSNVEVSFMYSTLVASVVEQLERCHVHGFYHIAKRLVRQQRPVAKYTS